LHSFANDCCFGRLTINHLASTLQTDRDQSLLFATETQLISFASARGKIACFCTPLRMCDVPELDIEFIAIAPRFQPGSAKQAPRLLPQLSATPFFAATGARLRHLPIRPAAVVQALSL
jgi:hypothetical protein